MPEQRLCQGCGKPYWLPAAWQHEKCVVVTPQVIVANNVANTESVVANESARVQKWREANREKYNARQRELMRSKRGSHPR